MAIMSDFYIEKWAEDPEGDLTLSYCSTQAYTRGQPAAITGTSEFDEVRGRKQNEHVLQVVEDATARFSFLVSSSQCSAF